MSPYPKGSSARRGYGYAHQQARKVWAAKVEAGSVSCARCAGPISPGSEWHLDHDDEDRTRYVGASHAKCNTSAGGQHSGRVRTGQDTGGLPEPAFPRYSPWVAAIHHEIAAEQGKPCPCGHCDGGVPVLVAQTEPEVEQPLRGFAY